MRSDLDDQSKCEVLLCRSGENRSDVMPGHLWRDNCGFSARCGGISMQRMMPVIGGCLCEM